MNIEMRPIFNGTRTRVMVLDSCSFEQSPWAEDKDDIQRGLEWGRKKARMLKWVESQMVLQLSPIERRCIELYYFEALNYREAAEVLSINASTVYRAINRGLKVLRPPNLSLPIA